MIDSIRDKRKNERKREIITYLYRRVVRLHVHMRIYGIKEEEVKL